MTAPLPSVRDVQIRPAEGMGDDVERKIAGVTLPMSVTDVVFTVWASVLVGALAGGQLLQDALLCAIPISCSRIAVARMSGLP